jgi:UDP-N-acetylmuramyl pentapeptide phosphotransferase/UDP-N-acetylglucosamine-1-phosphate transferase
MENILLGGILAFIITFYAIPIIMYIADQKNLYDVPDERKVHSHPISSLGGIGIFAGLILGLLISANTSAVSNTFQYVIAALLIVFFLGIKDDVLILTPMKKFLGQLMIAGL